MKSNAAVSQYYRDVAFDYTVFWNLRRSMAMRIGLWDRETRSVPQALEREDRFLAEEAGIHAGDHVLDAGCGVGGSAIFLARTYGCRVTGLTESADQARIALANARRSGVDHLVTFTVGDFHATGFDADSFSVVWALESMSHSNRKRDLLAELYRILRPGGRLIGADYFSAHAAYTETIQAMRRRVFEGLHFEEFEYAPLFNRYLTVNGFTHVDFFDVTPMALPSARRFYLLSALGSWAGGILQWLGLRTAAQNRLSRGLRDQYRALAGGIHQYRIFRAEKPVAVRAMRRVESGRPAGERMEVSRS